MAHQRFGVFSHAACIIPQLLHHVSATARTEDSVITIPLATDFVEATVEVGLSPSALQDRRAAPEFELRLVSGRGDVVSSDLVVRTRRGKKMSPTKLHVVLPDALRGMRGTLLQLVANNLDGKSAADLVRWAEPLMYCDHTCPAKLWLSQIGWELILTPQTSGFELQVPTMSTTVAISLSWFMPSQPLSSFVLESLLQTLRHDYACSKASVLQTTCPHEWLAR